jgi:hypothetical protein
MPSPTTEGPARSSEVTLAETGTLKARAPSPTPGDETDMTRAATPVTVEDEENHGKGHGKDHEKDGKDHEKDGKDYEKDHGKDSETEDAVKEKPAEEVEIEYPTGVAFTFIIVALVLSVFLVSLDMVRFLLSLLCLLMAEH